MCNSNTHTQSQILIFYWTNSGYFEISYPYDISDYISMHFAVLQNKINCLAATENATA